MALDLGPIAKLSLTVVRLSLAESRALEERGKTKRFSLTFQRTVARRLSRRSIALIDVAGGDFLQVAVMGVQRVSTLDDRATISFATRIFPASMRVLLRAMPSGLRQTSKRLAAGAQRVTAVSARLGEELLRRIARDERNAPALGLIAAQFAKPSRYQDARALQEDAVAIALKAFDSSAAVSRVAVVHGDTPLVRLRLLEDAIIEHDARWMEGWQLSASDVTGHATFQRPGARLDVFTANRRPLETLFGVDLVYLNRARGSLVMVQYKMLEPIRSKRDQDGARRSTDAADGWIVRLDRQFQSEIERMRRFDRDLEPNGAYRLNPGAFYVKLVRRGSSARSAGIILSLGHLEQLMDDGRLRGPRGGLLLSYETLDGHYLRGDSLVGLIHSGYIGTRGATTKHLVELVRAALSGDRAVVAALEAPARREGD